MNYHEFIFIFYLHLYYFGYLQNICYLISWSYNRINVYYFNYECLVNSFDFSLLDYGTGCLGCIINAEGLESLGFVLCNSLNFSNWEMLFF